MEEIDGGGPKLVFELIWVAKYLWKHPQGPTMVALVSILPRIKGCQDLPQSTEGNDGSLASQHPIDRTRL